MAIISNCTESTIKDAALALKEGHLVAFPTETVYGLGADATNEKAVARIYEVKNRPTDHPIIVHISSIELMDKWASEIPEYAINLARAFWPGPMTLILPRTELAKDFITGGQDTVAIRVPSNTLAIQLLEEFKSLGGYGVAAPSANRFGKVSPTNSQAVEEELGNFLLESDQILDGGQSQIGIESTIIDCTGKVPIILRPGAITFEMIKKVIEEIVEDILNRSIIHKVKAPGLLESHYAPKATVALNIPPKIGDGFIALSSMITPAGVIRLLAPSSSEEFAQQLYDGFRKADSIGLKRIIVLLPPPEGIGIAIIDRLKKASTI